MEPGSAAGVAQENASLTAWQASTFPQNEFAAAPSGATRLIGQVKPVPLSITMRPSMVPMASR